MILSFTGALLEICTTYGIGLHVVLNGMINSINNNSAGSNDNMRRSIPP